jgi:hypothetical protein
MLEETLDPRPSWLSRIAIDKCRIEFSKTPMVLLCGGYVPHKERAEDADPSIKSLRHALANSHPQFEIFRPEEITSWQEDGVFKNLMDYEEDLASICSLVVIVIESHGSIAELGAFSQFEHLRQKLIAIRSSKYQDAPSFINLGLLRHLKGRKDSSVKTFPWEIDRPESITSELLHDITSDIELELDELKGSEVFRTNYKSHWLVVVCEIINMFSALKEGEILQYLQSLQGISSPTTKDQLKQKLFLLEKFRIIKKIEYSDSAFYIRTDEPFHRLRIQYQQTKDEQTPDSDFLRRQVDCLNYYRADQKHRHRVRVIAQAKADLVRGATA